MGYMHIDNLYRDDRIFSYNECYALEKIHGTSAHIKYKADETDGNLIFFSGGESTEKFIALFDKEKLVDFFKRFGAKEFTFFGEAYGGKQQGMSATYGKDLKFVVFDVKVDGVWADVPYAQLWANLAGLDFVPYVRIPTQLSEIDRVRALPSVQAVKNGIIEPKEREGVVLRPLHEAVDKRGNRIITKHKNDAFKETKTQREVDPERLKILADAKEIAEEWVTENRLDHVLQQAARDNENAFHEGGYRPLDIGDTGAIIKMMIEDIKREAKGEILESKDAMKAIGTVTAIMFKRRISVLTKGE
jgi:hypothetical protein